jgi:hypothetical protein
MDYGRYASGAQLSDHEQRFDAVMNRLKALYRGWGIPCAGTQV